MASDYIAECAGELREDAVGLLSKVFGLAKARESVKLLEDAIPNLQFTIIATLANKYTPNLGEKEAMFLAVAVLHEAILVEPATEEGEDYLRRNTTLVMTEAARLSSDAQIAHILSYLYVAKILYLVYATGQSMSDQSVALANRATQLAIDIPNTYDICGSSDANACVRAISEYASTVAGAPSQQ
jgi:hypothetical protein